MSEASLSSFEGQLSGSERPILPVIRGYLSQVTAGMLATLRARAALLYLVSPNQEAWIPFLSAGELTGAEKAHFEGQPLDPATDALAYEIRERRRPVSAFQAVTDRRIAPSLVSSLGWRNILALPILEQAPSPDPDALLGMILIDRSQQREGFTREQIHLGETFATAIAMSLENARLYDELQRNLAENQSLHQVNTAMLQKLELGEVLSIVCAEACRLTGSAGSAVALLEDGEWLRIACSSGETHHPVGRFALDSSLLGLAVRRGEPILTNNRFENDRDQNETGGGSLLAIPLMTGGETIGVLDVVNLTRGFTQEDVSLLRRFADQASVAIEHARLYRESEDLAVEKERQRLARELHDSISQSLYGISMVSDAARRQIDRGNVAKARGYLDQLVATAGDALSQMRMLIFGLRPSTLQNQGLVEALRERIRAVEDRSGLKVGFKARLTGRLPQAVEGELYGIAQEALNNVLKHSRAHQVTVHLVQSGPVVILKIEDDGVGYDPQAVALSGGMGLKSMRERAAQIGAELKIETQPGAGVTVQVEVKL